MKRILSVSLLSLLFVNTTHAEEATKKYFEWNSIVPTKLSYIEPNKIIVKNDKITNVDCQNDVCLANYNKNGSAFVQLNPDKAEFTKNFMIYITTESDNDFTILVDAVNGIGTTNIFYPKNGNSKEAKEFEKKAPYSQMLAKLIMNMMTKEQSFEGFTILQEPFVPEIKKGKKKAVNVLEKTLLTTYQGDKFIGLKYLLRNNTNKDLTDFSIASFYGEDVVAGAIDNEFLKKGESTQFYLVLKKENLDEDI